MSLKDNVKKEECLFSYTLDELDNAGDIIRTKYEIPFSLKEKDAIDTLVALLTKTILLATEIGYDIKEVLYCQATLAKNFFEENEPDFLKGYEEEFLFDYMNIEDIMDEELFDFECQIKSSREFRAYLFKLYKESKLAEKGD